MTVDDGGRLADAGPLEWDQSAPETFSWDRESATRQVATGELGTPRSESAIAYLSARHEPVYFGTEEW